MAQAVTPKRVLVLHGYTQNASIFGKRIGALRKTLGKSVELVFVDAPVILRPADLVETFGSTADLGAAEATPDADDPALTPRAWWKTDASRTRTGGLLESVEVLRDILKAGRFDGVFGFSQGAAMAAILAALLERPHLFPPFLIDGAAPHPPFTFCIAASGFKPAGEFAARVFEGGYETPTLHVIGRNDVIVIEERSRSLVDVSKNARVEMHDGGHFVPSKANWRNFFKLYLLDPLGNVPGPSELPASGAATPAGNGIATPSGTATPAEVAEPAPAGKAAL
ncbi:FSH1-domain-containing protein [Vararia minispora EC-137]|uniref:FSH1-domain-containing protein n=1 Tax=Vararia minispora EC-137 TaxID=1314806 RepID=A0ACB8QSI1_9AGAM|nr:FSH1-domain-containing protein [Vararia minispora EC-137]